MFLRKKILLVIRISIKEAYQCASEDGRDISIHVSIRISNLVVVSSEDMLAQTQALIKHKHNAVHPSASTYPGLRGFFLDFSPLEMREPRIISNRGKSRKTSGTRVASASCSC